MPQTLEITAADIALAKNNQAAFLRELASYKYDRPPEKINGDMATLFVMDAEEKIIKNANKNNYFDERELISFYEVSAKKYMEEKNRLLTSSPHVAEVMKRADRLESFVKRCGEFKSALETLNGK